MGWAAHQAEGVSGVEQPWREEISKLAFIAFCLLLWRRSGKEACPGSPSDIYQLTIVSSGHRPGINHLQTLLLNVQVT